MKDLDVTQVFCEVLTGLGVWLVILPVLVLVGSYTVNGILLYAVTKLTIAGFGTVLLTSYLVGTMMDAVGLAVDQLFLYRLVVKKEPSEEDRATFWKNVSAHVLAYREAQWTYYSCYRNLFIIFAPGSILWTAVVWNGLGAGWAVGAMLGFIVLEVAFFVAMKALVEIYFNITKSV